MYRVSRAVMIVNSKVDGRSPLPRSRFKGGSQ